MTIQLVGIVDAATGKFCEVYTKKDLKLCKGDFLRFRDPSIYGQAQHPLDGEAMVIDPAKRSKFCQVWTDNEGRIKKVV